MTNPLKKKTPSYSIRHGKIVPGIGASLIQVTNFKIFSDKFTLKCQIRTDRTNYNREYFQNK